MVDTGRKSSVDIALVKSTAIGVALGAAKSIKFICLVAAAGVEKIAYMVDEVADAIRNPLLWSASVT